MVKNKKKSRFTAGLYVLLVCVFLGVSSGCGDEDEWISIEVEGAAAALTDSTETPSVRAEPETIQVYVCGAVAKPGVVSVPTGSRVEAALNAAGGFHEKAARDRINLADWVQDGQMLYFPAESEAAMGQAVDLAGQAGLVNINTATVDELCGLPGIGESRAADIIDYRERCGSFTVCEDIMKVPGIKDSLYQKLKDKITVR